MNAVSRWSRGSAGNGDGREVGGAVSPFASFYREMDAMLTEVFDGLGFSRQHLGSAGWPVIEVQEQDDRLLVSAELPGLEQRDVEVTFHEGILTLKGERKPASSTRYSERWAGHFDRQISIGADADPDQITATFKNGVLSVSVLKKPEAQRQVRRIAVQ